MKIFSDNENFEVGPPRHAGGNGNQGINFVWPYKSFFRVAVNTYVPIFRGLDARGGRKLRTDTHTHTQKHTGQLQ